MAWNSVIWRWDPILPHIWVVFVKGSFSKELQNVPSLIAFFQKCVAYLPPPWLPTAPKGFTSQFIRYTTTFLACFNQMGQQVCMPKCVTFHFMIHMACYFRFPYESVMHINGIIVFQSTAHFIMLAQTTCVLKMTLGQHHCQCRYGGENILTWYSIIPWYLAIFCWQQLHLIFLIENLCNFIKKGHHIRVNKFYHVVVVSSPHPCFFQCERGSF